MLYQSSSPLAPLSNRTFLSYWLTGLAANLGWLIQMVGASWLMTTIGGTPELVALVQTSVALPVLLLGLPAGALADALGRRRVVIWSQSFILLVSVALALVSYLGTMSPWVLLGFTFALGCGKAINNPGWLTMVGEFMPRTELAPAIALNSVGFNLARSFGPAVGGAIVAAVGAFAAFAINAIGNLGVILFALRWKAPETPRDLPPEPVGTAMVAGLRYVIMSPHMLLVVLRAAWFSLAAISVMALAPLIARDVLGGGPTTYGVILGAFGIGAVAGAFLGSPLRAKLSLEAMARAGFLVFAAGTVAVGLSTSMVLTLAASALCGAAWLLTLSTFNATVQMTSPRWVVSRCQAIYQACSFGANALGSLVWGAIAGQSSTEMSLLVSAVVLVAGAAIGLRLPLRELDALGLDPFSRWVMPEIKVDVLPRSGPIETEVEYRIGEADTAAFLAEMAERRRTRRRDGARRWTLTRDMEDPQVWTERYQTATWIETRRHHQRRTVADAEVTDRLRALNAGGEKPRVRYRLVRQPEPANRGPMPVGVDPQQ